MKFNFEKCLEWVLKHEGGLTDDPYDPGSLTNKGITIFRFAEHRKVKLTIRNGKPVRDQIFQELAAELKKISNLEVSNIYYKYYWSPLRCDDLPPGVDYAIFDFGVNSGPARSAKYLQGIVKVHIDGKIGPVTLAAVNKADPKYIVTEICKRRQEFLRGLNTFWRFGKGWTRRVNEVKTRALEMCK